MSKRPAVEMTKGAGGFHSGLFIGNDCWIISNEGVPTDGASGTGATWAGKGSTVHDVTNGVHYINTGTKASPTWTKTGTQS